VHFLYCKRRLPPQRGFSFILLSNSQGVELLLFLFLCYLGVCFPNICYKSIQSLGLAPSNESSWYFHYNCFWIVLEYEIFGSLRCHSEVPMVKISCFVSILVLNGPIYEAMVLVRVQVQWTHLEEGEQAEVDFHPHCHRLKKNKLE
jgi:hypothetical protein